MDEVGHKKFPSYNSAPTQGAENLHQSVLLPLDGSVEGELNVECLEKGAGCSQSSAVLPAGPGTASLVLQQGLPKPWGPKVFLGSEEDGRKKGVLENHQKPFAAGRRAEESKQPLSEKGAATVSRRLRSTNHC